MLTQWPESQKMSDGIGAVATGNIKTASSFVSEARNLLYDYTSEKPASAVLPGLWTRSYFYPFVSVFSPFSHSVLAEISRRAWFHYYSRLGHDIGFAPKNLVRSVDGRPYLDLKWLCEQDVAFAGLPPLSLHLNQKAVNICPWEKPGLVAGFKFGRNQKKIDDLLNGLGQDIGKITERIRAWHGKVRSMRWTQAEILQIMEEIERFGIDSLLAYFAARHNLERSYNGLLAMLPGGMTAHNLSLINNSLSDLDGLLEVDLTTRILALAKLAVADSKLMAWLGDSPAGDWSATVPPGPFAEGVQALLADFGHWTTGVGEMSHPVWAEEPELILAAILACAKKQTTAPKRVPSTAARQQLLDAVDGKNRKQAEQSVEMLRRLTVLQSQALNAYSYLLAGSRIWARAAGQEAAADGRLLDPQDVFLFELEEIKQMMTGEWNITSTDEIRQRAEERRGLYGQWQEHRAPAAFFGETPAWTALPGLPSVAGRLVGPLRPQDHLRPVLCQDAVVGARRVDSGWSPTLPVAGGFIAAAGSPLDPIIAAARVWHVPTVVGLGAAYDKLVGGAQTTLDGTTGLVEQ
jgi:phosphohistidine swiveling domain-containing protein